MSSAASVTSTNIINPRGWKNAKARWCLKISWLAPQFSGIEQNWAVCGGEGRMFCFVFTTRSSITQAVLKLNITKNSLEFLILLLQPPECWNSSCVPLGLANGFAGDVAQAPCHTGKPSAHYAPCPVPTNICKW